MPNKVLETVVFGFGWLAKCFSIIGVTLILGTFTVAMIGIYGPPLEGKYFPVMTEMDITELERHGDQVEFLVAGRKVRQCTLKSIGALSQIDGKWELSIVTFGTPTGKLNRSGRPLGQQSLGLWFTKPTGTKVKFVSSYKCHEWWDTVTELGEIELRK